MNIDRLIRVRDQFIESPALLSMDDYIASVYDQRNEPCGTVLCIAGAAAIDAGFIALRSTPRPGTAACMYDLTPAGEAEIGIKGTTDMFAAALDLGFSQAQRLFFVENWPTGHRKQFEDAKDATARARVTGRRIDQFIATGGRE